MDEERSRPDDAAEPEEDDVGGPPEDLEEDPAYNPDDEGLKQIKGG